MGLLQSFHILLHEYFISALEKLHFLVKSYIVVLQSNLMSISVEGNFPDVFHGNWIRL